MHTRTGTISRRGLLQAGGAAMVGAAFGDIGAAAAAVTSNSGLKRSRFSPYVGQKVTLTPTRGMPITGKLVSVEDVPAKALKGSQNAYVLRFRSKATPSLGTHITTVRHPRFGSVDLLMSAGGRAKDGQDYLAVVNRVVS